MVVYLRTVRIPDQARDRFLAWIEDNRALREEHGILFELVLDRTARQNLNGLLAVTDSVKEEP